MDPNGGCWLWNGALFNGYGSIRDNGAEYAAHRYSYSLHYGPIPDGLFVCHRCDVPACVNPAHLFLGTHADNMADMARKGRAARQGGPRGSLNSNARLNEKQVAEIIASPEGARKIAARLGVTPAVIGRIRRRQAWRHVSVSTEQSSSPADQQVAS